MHQKSPESPNVAQNPRSNVSSMAMFVDVWKKQLRSRRKRKGSSSTSRVSLEPFVRSNRSSATQVCEMDGRAPNSTGSTLATMPLTKARSSSDISMLASNTLYGFSDSLASESSIYASLDRTHQPRARNDLRHQSSPPAHFMDDFVDFVAHTIVPLMNEIAKYNDAFIDARHIINEGRTQKEEFVFYSLLNSNILPTFHRIAKLINQYSQAIACDVRERYTTCGAIQKQMDFAKGLIGNTMRADDFFEKKDKDYWLGFLGSKLDNLQLPLRVRRCLLDFEAVHKGSAERSLPLTGGPGSCMGRIVGDLAQGFGLQVIDVESIFLSQRNHSSEPSLENIMELVKKAMRNASSEAGFLIDLVPNLKGTEKLS
ncbi:uncharacterized protein LOC100901079 [Galendromus occidentalis]|uniref:Uncharacterized protein LOC100901079 n=1 Tax=Galendromus occidentalis TaxID=34638 RepID=A0AAJ6QWE4_9ACAR|nr:uncharacterized protein LOC100901079 [Galendromus occidentalis]